MRIVRGEPTAEELAALVAVLAVRGRTTPAAASGYEAWRAARLAALSPRRARP